MKKTLALLAVPAIMMAASTATAENKWGVTPYVGADAEWRHLSFQKGQGDNLFNHDFPQGNIYAGLKFNEFIAIEGGYEATAKKTRTVNVDAGNSAAGVLVPATGQFSSTSQIKGLHANLVGFLPVSETYKLELLGLVGFARLQETLVANLISLNGLTTSIPRTYKQRRTALRIGGGVQQMINESWGVRAMMKWENTNKIKTGAQEGGPSLIKDRNSFIYSLGTFITF